MYAPCRPARRTLLVVASSLLIAAAGVVPAAAQTGELRGAVVSDTNGAPLSGVRVEVLGTRFVTVTGADGRWALAGVTPGEYTIRIASPGRPVVDRALEVVASETREIDVRIGPPSAPHRGAEVRVASGRPEPLMEATTSVSVVPAGRIEDRASTNQAGLLLADVPGLHMAQGGFNRLVIASRSFSTIAGRRMLVQVDGRDLASTFSNRPEWAALHLTEPGTSIEVARGPMSARYGALAFGGVVDIRTPAVRETRGGRLRVGVGDLESRDVIGRWAVVSEDVRWGLRFAGGVSTTRGYDRSRTDLDDLAREYAGVTDSTVAAPPPGFEWLPLAGQRRTTAEGAPGPAVGDIDPQTTLNASVRLDRYLNAGGIVTAEAGMTRIENQVTSTNASRLQIDQADVPWARFALLQGGGSLTAYYSGRTRSGVDLASGARVEDRSGRFHAEMEGRGEFRDGRLRLQLGVAARAESFDSRRTLLEPAADGRTEGYLAAFSRFEFDLLPDLELSGTTRLEDATLWGDQLSSRWALRWSPSEAHALRLTWADGYTPPTVADEFTRVAVSEPVDLLPAEAVIRGSPLGPSMAGVPDGELFTNSSAVPFLVIGNPDLDPETVDQFELGYRGLIGSALVTAEVYYSEFEDFITELLPGVNPSFGRWEAPAAIPGEAGALVGAFARDLVPGLTRLEDGRTAIVYSGTNAGRATQWGLDLGVEAQATEELQLQASWSVASIHVDEESFIEAPRAPNVPRHLVALSAVWERPGGARARVSVTAASGFDFRDGAFAGYVPDRQSVDVDLRTPLVGGIDAAVTVLNALDQRRFHYFGGSVIGRRIVLSATWMP